MLLKTLLFYRNVSSLSKEEKQTKLSEDTSHCCWKTTQQVPKVTLPHKTIISKVPLCMIAVAHRTAVLSQPDQQLSRNSSGATTGALLTNGFRPDQTPFQPRPQLTPTNQMLRQKLFRQSSSELYRPPNPQMLNRFAHNVRPSPYPPMTQIVSFPNRLPCSTPRLFQAVNTSCPGRNIIVNQTFCNEVINVDDDSPPRQMCNNTTSVNKRSHDIAWLEKGVYEIKGALVSLNSLTDQFLADKETLKYDLPRAVDLSEKLTTSVKQAIMTMAKINEDISSGRQAAALDSNVSLIMKDIGLGRAVRGLPTSKNVQVQITKKLEPTRQVRDVTASVPAQSCESSSIDSSRRAPPEDPEQTRVEDEADEIGVNPALLCETVLHVEGNKENNDGNKSTMSTPQKDQGAKTPQKVPGKRGRPQGSYVKITARKSFPNRPRGSYVKVTDQKSFPRRKVEIIDLIDCKENDYQLCKKFNIKPCKVVLVRLGNKH